MKVQITGSGCADSLDSFHRQKAFREGLGDFSRRLPQLLRQFEAGGQGEVAHLERGRGIQRGGFQFQTIDLRTSATNRSSIDGMTTPAWIDSTTWIMSRACVAITSQSISPPNNASICSDPVMDAGQPCLEICEDGLHHFPGPRLLDGVVLVTINVPGATAPSTNPQRDLALRSAATASRTRPA